jgi:Ni/Fe-hydrogenase subunit HybB-like protein
MEAFMSWYSGNPNEMFMYHNRATGPYMVFFWSLILCNILIPQSLWSSRVRQSIPRLFFVALVINVGMWLERFIIIITSLHRDFLPSSWGMYYPTQWDWAVFLGTIGFFLVLMILFVRVLPSISIFEVREVLHHLAPHVLDDGKPSPTPAHGD